MLNIDTTKSLNNYPKLFRDVYFKNKFKLRKEFTLLIDKISYDNKNNIDWWVSNIAERNLNSNLFHTICLYFSLKEIIKKKKVDKIIVEDIYIYKNIKNIFNKTIILKKKRKRNLIKITKTFFYHNIIFFFVKLFVKKKLFTNQINIVDRFQTGTNLKIDRYYNNYFKNKKYIYLITFVGLNFLKTFRCIIQMKSEKFILIQNYITFMDLIYSFGYLFRKNLLIKKNYKFRNLEISELLKEELNNLDNLNATIIGIQNFLLIKKLKDLNFRINKFINWFENSNVDKGFNFGFKKFLPNVRTIGYQGFFVEKEWMYLDPSNAEYMCGVIPKKIVCINSKLIKSRKEYCKKLKVFKGINIRFQNNYNCNYKAKYNDSILVVLNIDKSNSEMVIKEVIKSKFCILGKKIFIKEHPLLKLDKFYHSKLPNNIKIIHGDYASIIKKFKVVISSGSTSSIIEAILANCNIIFPFNNYFDNYNLEELNISKKIYRVCKKANDLDNSINFFLDSKKFFYDTKTLSRIFDRKNNNYKMNFSYL